MSGLRYISRLAGMAGVGGASLLMLRESSDLNEMKQKVLNKFLISAEEFADKTSIKWNFNWDARNEDETLVQSKASRNIILIRHGQYNLDGKEDSERYLTEMGLEQAKITGDRLAEMSLPYTSISVSRMTRAVQTANIIHQSLPQVPLLPEDGILNEGGPILPDPRSSWRPECQWSEEGGRIEAAFRKYFHRADPTQTEDSYEIVVCHANVIRYFLCRALQLPPEAWLRFSLRHASFTWIVIRPDGKVHCRGIGESGHLPVNHLSVCKYL